MVDALVLEILCLYLNKRKMKKENAMRIKNWYTKAEIAHLGHVSEKTVERKRNQLLEMNPDIDWFNTKKKPHLFSYKMLNEFLAPEIFSLIKENQQLGNTIRCLYNTGTIEHHLTMMDWDYFITISYEDALDRKRCFSIMHDLYERFENNCFGGKTRMFFTTEAFTNRKGCHNHFILKFEDANPKHLKEFIENNCPKGIVDIKPYDKFKAGVFYVAKDGTQGEDWDIMGNRLKEDGNMFGIGNNVLIP